MPTLTIRNLSESVHAALLAYLFREIGHEVVSQHIDNACISAVNLSEVLGCFFRDGVDTKPLLQQLEQTSIEVAPFTQEHALFVAELIPLTKPYGLSLGDRACFGLAASRKSRIDSG
jgi:PIN domain nuclease of toxin-antitoxin system